MSTTFDCFRRPVTHYLINIVSEPAADQVLNTNNTGATSSDYTLLLLVVRKFISNQEIHISNITTGDSH